MNCNQYKYSLQPFLQAESSFHEHFSEKLSPFGLAFPGRHQLVIGDSTLAVPQYALQNPGRQFDLIFIDGGHQYHIALADIIQCKALAHTHSIFLMDDISYNSNRAEHTAGPTNALDLCVQRNIVDSLFVQEFGLERGIAWGRYKFTRS